MELYQLRCFIAVAQSESITKAAGQLCTTQPALSRVIQRLESELGAKLFDRSPGKISLNGNGKMFYSSVSKALESIDEAARLASSSGCGVVRIASHLPARTLSATYDRCQAEHPQVDFKFSDNHGHVTESQEEYDILLSPAPTVQGMLRQRSYREKWCVILSKRYFGDPRTSISTDMLAKEPIVFYGSEDDRLFLTGIFDSVGETPNFITAGSKDAAFSLINRRLAVGCLPSSILYEYAVSRPPSIPFAYLTLDDAEFERDIYLYRSNGFPKTQAESEILHFIEENVDSFMQTVNDYYSEHELDRR